MTRSQKGSTLIEVLFALVFLALALPALTTPLVATIHANHHASRVATAANLARDKLEEFRAVDYATIGSGSDPSPLVADGQSGGAGAIYTRSWVVAAGPTATTKEVTVSVEWTDPAKRQVVIHSALGG